MTRSLSPGEIMWLQIATIAVAWLVLSAVIGLVFGAVVRIGKGNHENPNG
jgi:hypothetical protein